jgi:HSP20 family protein
MLPTLYRNSPIAQRSGGPINRLLDQFFNDDDFFAPLASPAWSVMPLSLWEDDDSIHVEVDAPGMTDKDIDVSVHGDQLVIRAERKYERKENGYDTRSYGRFEQRVTLPADVDADNVDAKLSDGVLRLTFPKCEAAKPKRITLKTE